MRDPYQFPKLRWPIDVRFERFNSQEILLLTCPLGIAPEPLALVPVVAPIISSFEGALSVTEITAKFASRGLTDGVVQQLVQLLDQHAFLDSPKFAELNQKVRDDFGKATTRAASSAGLGYASDRGQLTQEIESYLALAPISNFTPPSNMIGLVSPHIDYRRGKQAYGATYVHLRPEQHDLYLLVGTAHQYSPHLFHLTAKAFDNPLGLVQTDTDFVHSLARAYGERAFADEFLHRREHSLELQIPFLRYIKEHAQIAPILIGSFHHMLKSGHYPEHFEPYEAFASSLTTAIKGQLSQQRKICFLAGVDMAHVGAAFGDKQKLTPDFMVQIEERDLKYLDTLSGGNPHALFDHIAEDEDQRKICGFPTMYLVLDVLSRLGLRYKAELFDYRQAVDYERQCAVTFAGMGLYAEATRAVYI